MSQVRSPGATSPEHSAPAGTGGRAARWPGAAAGALALLWAAVGPAAAQDADSAPPPSTPGLQGVQVEGTGLWSTIVGGAFPHDETGLGATVGVRHRWRNGASVGLTGIYAQPEDLSLDSRDRRRTMEQVGVSAEFRYSLARLTPVRPFVGAQVGWMRLRDEGFNAETADGTGMSYGLVAGTEVWPTDRFGVHLSAVGAGFDISGFFPEGSTSAATLQVRGGVTVFLGDVTRDEDGDGVEDGADACPGTPGGIRVDGRGCARDRDADGVPDHVDACPESPAGADVDGRGCPTDADGDGVYDGLDRCPATPGGAPVDDDGCMRDRDGDGVHDGLDECPDTPEGVAVDERGCRPDADGDGIPDVVDDCPGTPSGADVNETGCSRVQQGLNTGEISLPGLPFEYNPVGIRGASRRVVDEIGQRLAENPELRMEIRVRTDTTGAAVYNQRMSQVLAEGVRSYLLRNFSGIDPDQLRAVGYGESPLPGEEDRPARSGVEFVVVEEEEGS